MKRVAIATVEVLDIDQDKCVLHVLAEGTFHTYVLKVGDCVRLNSMTVEPSELTAVAQAYVEAIDKARRAN